MRHCEWIKTSFLVSSLFEFCSKETSNKGGVVIERLLFVENLIVLVLLQTKRIFDLTWNELQQILNTISKSKQPENMIELSCNTFILILELMTNTNNNNNNDNNENVNNKKTLFVEDILLTHQKEILMVCVNVIPKKLTSLRMLTPSQLRLCLRIYHVLYQQMEDKNQSLQLVNGLKQQNQTFDSVSKKSGLISSLLVVCEIMFLSVFVCFCRLKIWELKHNDFVLFCFVLFFCIAMLIGWFQKHCCTKQYGISN